MRSFSLPHRRRRRRLFLLLRSRWLSYLRSPSLFTFFSIVTVTLKVFLSIVCIFTCLIRAFSKLSFTFCALCWLMLFRANEHYMVFMSTLLKIIFCYFFVYGFDHWMLYVVWLCKVFYFWLKTDVIWSVFELACAWKFDDNGCKFVHDNGFCMQ